LTLDPGAQADVTFTFTPPRPGQFNGVATVTSDDPFNAVLTAGLTGIGVSPANHSAFRHQP